MANVYDLMLLLDASAPDERRARIVSDVEAAISSGGSLIAKHDWGRRNLAYEIRHQADAEYHLFQFDGPSELLQRLGHSLKIADGVLRFRIIRLKPGAPLPPPPRSDHGPRQREERGEGTVAARAAADAPSRSESPA